MKAPSCPGWQCHLETGLKRGDSDLVGWSGKLSRQNQDRLIIVAPSKAYKRRDPLPILDHQAFSVLTLVLSLPLTLTLTSLILRSNSLHSSPLFFFLNLRLSGDLTLKNPLHWIELAIPQRKALIKTQKTKN